MRRIVAFLTAIALAATPVFAQTRVLTGTITDADSREPLDGAQIAVKGSPSLRATARENGTFTISVPTLDIVLTVRRIGYPLKEFPVAAATSNVTIVLKKDPLKLDEVVVTGQASEVSRRNLANSVASVDAADLTKVPAVSIEHALQAKIPGAQIQQNTGAPGGGNRIRIRGTSSILGNAQPLYVVDGVITSDVAIAPGTNRVTRAGGATAITTPSQENPVNRIADLNPDDIENIEVLKGSAAAAIYGSKASGGVIMITTKRGRPGATQYSVRTAVGTSRLSYHEGSRKFKTLADAQAAFGARTPAFWTTAWTPNNSFDYEDLVFGEKPTNYETALNVSGGGGDTRYYVSTLLKRDEGIVKNTFADKKSVRLNLDQTLGSRFTLSAGAEIVRNAADRGLFGNDNAGNSIAYTVTKLPSFYDFRLQPTGIYPENPFYPSNPFQTISLLQNREVVWRSLTTARVQAEALNSASQQLRFVANGGVDVFTQRNNVFSPPELYYEDDDTRLGTAVASYAQNLQYNLNLNAVHVLTPRTGFQLTSQIGTQYEVRDLDQTRTVGENLLGGLAIPVAGTLRDIDNNRLSVYDFGIFAQTEMLLGERLYLNAGMRADRSSNDGDIAKMFVFPKFSGSYRIPNPSYTGGKVDELKVRVAYGETGNQPQYGQKFTTLGSGSIGGLGGFTLGGTRGFSDIRPERQREIEGGIDASFLGNRAQLELTGFERNISDLLISRTLAPTTGFATEVYNGASMRVRGFEAAINAFPIQTARFGGVTWNARFNIAHNASTITKLPVAAFLISTPQVGAIQIKEGVSATVLVGNDTVAVAGTCPPAPVDPTVCATRKVGDVVAVYMGDGNPKYNAGFGNEIRWKSFSVYGLLDRQKGGMLAAGTWRHFDLGQNSRDYDDPSPDPTKPLGKWRTDTYLRLTRIYYQDVSYYKLRELTFGYDLPNSFTSRFMSRAKSARLTVSGRNLKTWTNFRGGDPDYSNFGGTPESLQRNRELASYPPSRSFWFTLSTGF